MDSNTPDAQCVSCGTHLPAEAAFCLKCGTPVQGSPASAIDDPLLEALEKAVGSQYEIMRLLGRGGMGAVYLARERALDRLVAIKVLPPEATDPESIERFRREARTAANLTHPNIVPLHAFGEAEGMMYFVMGFVRGESLGGTLRRRTRPSTYSRTGGDRRSLLDGRASRQSHCAVPADRSECHIR